MSCSRIFCYWVAVVLLSAAALPGAMGAEVKLTGGLTTNQFTVLGSKKHAMSFTWDLYRPVPPGGNASTISTQGYDPTDILEMTMTVAEGRDRSIWAGVGFSPWAMEGPFIACVASGSALTGGTCYDYYSDVDYEVDSLSPKMSTLVRSTLSAAGTATYTYRVPVERIGITPAKHRIIFSFGEWDWEDSEPDEHTGSDIDELYINFYSGEVAPKSGRVVAVAYGVSVAIVVLVTLIAFLVNLTGFLPSLGTQRLLWGLMYLILFGLCLFVFLLCNKAYRDQGRKGGEAISRAFGNVVAFLFFLVLWPTTKHIGPVYLLGMAYERFLTPHIVIACGIFLFMTVHFFWMIAIYAKHKAISHVLDGGGSMPMNQAAGFISWILMLLFLMIPGLFMRRKLFTIFRLSHFMFLGVMIAGAVHHWQMWLLIAPSLFFWILDVIIRFVSHCMASPTVESARFYQSCQLVELDIRVSSSRLTKVKPAQYVFLGFQWLPGVLHPFSIATVDPEQNLVKFFIKANEGEFCWTRMLANNVRNHPKQLGKTFWFGPYGSLQVPLEKTKNIVLLSGGIGVTPMMTTLQYLVQNGGLREDQTLTFIWVVPEPSIVQVIGPHIDALLVSLRATSASLNAVVHITRSAAELEVTLSVLQVRSKRPSLGEYFADVVTNGNSSGRTTLYACGPELLVADGVAHAQKLSMSIHTETFEF